MAGDKPVREMDTILIRVPDGMKKRVAERARANGRSMSSEVLSILETAMDEAGSARMRELEALCKELEIEEITLRARLSEIVERQEAAASELMRRKLVDGRRERERKAAHDIDTQT